MITQNKDLIYFFEIFFKKVLTNCINCIIITNTVNTVIAIKITERRNLMIQIDLSDHRPLYEQIKDKLKELIITGAVSENEKIPSVRELAQELTINPNTIQRAYKDLESEGFIYSVRAKGSFASPVSHIRKRTETQELKSTFIADVRQACFLGVPKDELIKTINEIYQEQEMTADD